MPIEERLGLKVERLLKYLISTATPNMTIEPPVALNKVTLFCWFYQGHTNTTAIKCYVKLLEIFCKPYRFFSLNSFKKYRVNVFSNSLFILV